MDLKIIVDHHRLPLYLTKRYMYIFQVKTYTINSYTSIHMYFGYAVYSLS